MAIDIKVRCSECETIREVLLGAEEKELVCPVCGRRMASLTADEHKEIEGELKKQRTFSIIAIALFAIAIICVFMWIGPAGAWPSGKDISPEGKIIEATKSVEPNVGPLVAAGVCALASLVLGILGSMKRYVVEF